MADHYVVFTAEITPLTANNFITLLTDLIPQNPDKLIISMNSQGGNVVAGISVYNMLKAMPYPIVTHNVGNVDSISNIIFLGAAERYACPAATFMYHGIG